MSYFVKIALRVISIVVILYVGLSIFGAIAIMEIPHLPLKGSPSSVGVAYCDVSFPSRDDSVTLKGWYLASLGNSVIIIVHGGIQNRIDYDVDTLGLARDLTERGYDLLLFDLRGRGESNGRGRSLANNEQDIGGAIDYLNRKGFSSASIGIIGFCSGAASSCIFAGEENIGALVLNGCFASVRGMINSQATSKGIPRFLLDFFIPGVAFTVKTFYGYEPVDPIDVVPDITCPILFIHEENDNLITWKETYQLFMASNNPCNEIWEVKAAEHSQAYKMYSSYYVDRLDNFFTTSLKNTLVNNASNKDSASDDVLSQQ
jgi:pimeloyl-ACP methyl ester carboxylesterase